MASRVFPWFAVLLILIPALEIFIFVQVGQVLSYFVAVLLLIMMAVLGSYLLRQQGISVLNRFRLALMEGRSATAETFDGMIIGVSALLMLIPGFFSDALALLLLIPQTRRWLLQRLLQKKQDTVVVTVHSASAPFVALNNQVNQKPNASHYDYDGDFVRKE